MADDRDARIAELEAENAALREQRVADRAELDAARRQLDVSGAREAAVGEVLRAIAAMPSDRSTVLNAIASAAMRFTDSDAAGVQQEVGRTLLPVGMAGWSEARLGRGQVAGIAGPPLSPDTISGRAFLDRRTLHVPDVASAVESAFPGSKPGHLAFGNESVVATPLMRDKQAIGFLVVYRFQRRAYTPDEIALLQTFADQAVIAIENARLFEELQDANQQLAEASQHKSQFLGSPAGIGISR